MRNYFNNFVVSGGTKGDGLFKHSNNNSLAVFLNVPPSPCIKGNMGKSNERRKEKYSVVLHPATPYLNERVTHQLNAPIAVTPVTLVSPIGQNISTISLEIWKK